MGRKFRLIDQDGNFLSTPPFEQLRAFGANGLAPISFGPKSWGFINESGEVVISGMYDSVNYFDENHIAQVWFCGDVRWINEKGVMFKTEEDAISDRLQSSQGILKTDIDLSKNPNISLKEYVEHQIGTWNDFLMDPSVEFRTEDEIKAKIESALCNWQKKGEFETTEDWKARVTDSARKEKAHELSARLIQSNAENIEMAKRQYQWLYRLYAERYCSYYSDEFAKQTMTLEPYDADNQSYLITTESYGDILLPVPIEEAKSFKSRWEYIKPYVSAVFIPSGDGIALKSVRFGQYVYDSNTETSYAQVDIDYNFNPLDVEGILANAYNPSNVQAPNVSANVENALKTSKIEHKQKKLVARNTSETDVNIPSGKKKADRTFAVVIANSHYDHASDVEEAENDGRVFAEYLTKTLGVPEGNVTILMDATYGHISSAMSHLQGIADVYKDSDFNVLFYYVGHGLPDDESKRSYLLPVDVDPKNTSICLPLDKLYADLGGLGAKSVTVMIDACFSGANHGDGMLLPQARGVALKPKPSAPVGNMVVISAASSSETAFPYEEKSHGLFTYWLLKKLQDTKGNVTLGELSDYIIDNVQKTSVVVNHKRQTPTVVASREMSETWRDIKFGK